MEPNKRFEQPMEINKKKPILNKVKSRLLYVGLTIEAAGNRAWKGAAAGAAGVLIVFAALFGLGLETGLGSFVDFLVVFIPGAALALLSPYILLPFIMLLKKMPSRFLAVVSSSVVLLVILLSQVRSTQHILPLSYALIGIGIISGGGIGYWWNSSRKKGGNILVLCFGLVCLGGSAGWLVSPGIERYPLQAEGVSPKQLEADDPSQTGNYQVSSFTYGSGTDKRRLHFGAEVDYHTDTVNASLVAGGWNKYRSWYWGFDKNKVPVNGTVWMPEGKGEFPLVLMVHGNHRMEEFSDTGYAYLGELLASRGYIAVSLDENFFNTSSWSGGLNNEISARAWMMLKHLDQIKDFDQSKNNPLSEKVDFDNVALLGHSRGGQAAAVAAEYNKLERYPNNGILTFNFDYNIKSVIAIAPTDYFTLGDKPVQLENINYFLLHGSYDSDLSEFSGDRQYDGVKFTDGNEWFKSSIYIHGANHGQFNTVWGDNDTAFPMSLFINKKPLIEGDEQRQVAKTYISAFLDTTLKGNEEYKPMFRDYSYALDWLPDTVYVNRYQDNSFIVMNDYENDYELTTGNIEGFDFKGARLRIWSEGMLKTREDADRDNYGAYLKWNQSYSDAGKYEMKVPDSYFAEETISEDDLFTFSAANLGESNNLSDFSIRMETSSGETSEFSLNEWLPLAPPLHIQHTKTWFYQKARYGSSHEPVLQTFSIPFSKLSEEGKIKISDVTKIAFVFNKSSEGYIYLDEIGIDKAGH
ncbi:alpha/beta hydrolase family protein [Bacillus sp. AK031]